MKSCWGREDSFELRPFIVFQLFRQKFLSLKSVAAISLSGFTIAKHLDSYLNRLDGLRLFVHT